MLLHLKALFDANILWTAKAKVFLDLGQIAVFKECLFFFFYESIV